MKFAADVLNLHPDCLAEVCNTPPYYAERYERWRETAGTNRPPENACICNANCCGGRVNYQVQTTGRFRLQRRQMARFSRKLAKRAPAAADLLTCWTAARGVAGR